MPRLSKVGAAALAAFGWTGLSSVTASYLQVAGGGGGGSGDLGSIGGAGGGAGGYLTGTTSLNTTQSYTVVVGAGGAGGVYSGAGVNGVQGSNSQFGVLTASVGGGFGAYGTSGVTGGNGGSGGGGTFGNGGGTATSGQGSNGGTGSSSLDCRGSGGGGGASAVGSNGSSAGGGNGGNGTASSITGSSVTYAGGGGGGALYRGGGFTVPTVATGGSGGGGSSGTGTGGNGNPGTANLGGGGGGPVSINAGTFDRGGNGGSGVVIISYVGAQQFGGGIVTSSGGSTIHTFTTSGTLSPLSSLSASYLIVAGGGSGGVYYGGGGGAGGLLAGSGVTIDTNSIYVVTVGAGAAAAVVTGSGLAGNNGANSSFSAYATVAVGGGAGGYVNVDAATTGGSGGGAGGSSGSVFSAKAGTSGQGNAGGTNGTISSPYPTGGGGGAGAVGANGAGSQSGAGGAGTASSISGTSVTYAGGGGGGGTPPGSAAGAGGSGGGGAGSTGSANGTAGTANTGGGGGGASSNAVSTASGAGGSGIVIISYAGSTQQMAGGTVTVAGGNVIHTFTSSGYLAPIYSANNSLRFRSSASAYLNRTPSVASNRKTWTWSAWVKRGGLSSNQSLFAVNNNGADYQEFRFQDSNTLRLILDAASLNYAVEVPTVVWRDVSAWYHIVLAVDTTQATSTNRVKIYVNGIQQTVTALSGFSLPAQNFDTYVNATLPHAIGNFNYLNSLYFDGYMAEVNFIDGQALTPNSFGTSNGLGVWQPIRYGGSYGTNGFYLPFTGGSSFYGSFNGSSQYLQATLPATLSGAFTLEFFLYRSGTGNQFCFTLGDSNTSTGLEYYIGTTGTVNNVYSSSSQISTSSNVPVANAWNHVAITRDSSNVVRLFVNGVQAGGTWTTTAAFSSTLRIGVEFFSSSITGYVNGGLSNFRVVNGTALYTNTFAPPTSALTAVSGTAILTLQSSTIIDNSGNSLSITNNGTVTTSQAYPFTMLGNQSKDYSPQGNNWTNNNIGVLAGSTLDIMTDVPTLTSATAANYAVLNPLKTNSSTCTLSDGNLKATFPSGAAGGIAMSTIGVSSGKWYWELTVGGTDGATQPKSGVIPASTFTESSSSLDVGTYGYVYGRDGDKTILGTKSAYGASFTTNDIIGYALDMDAGTLVCYKNNTSQGTLASGISGTIAPALTAYNGYSQTINFGQRPFAYTPPTGFVALNTFNLTTPTIGATAATTANKYMNAVTYTGTSGTQSVTGVGFQPDFVWIKNRTSTLSHVLQDAVRGTTAYLVSNATTAENTNTASNWFRSFNSDGFTVATLTDPGGVSTNEWNNTGYNYVSWNWNAGGSNATNTSGTITSTVRANTTAGFSIVTGTTLASGTLSYGHGLGVTPAMVIYKSRATAGQNWWVWHQSLPNAATGRALQLNTTSAEVAGAYFGTPAVSSSIVTLAAAALNSDSFVSYVFAQIAGYSAFGSYTGNGSSDGSFVFTGFRPRYVMIKRTNTTGDWIVYDSARSTYNGITSEIYPNLSNAEDNSSVDLDFVSNGIKLRNSGSGVNASGDTYIYACFAESPFKYANAR